MTPTENLKHEHKAISLMLGIMTKIADNIKLERGFNLHDLESIVDFIKIFADKCHHGKEETVLFPALIIAGIPNENGPIGVMLQEHAIGRNYTKLLEKAIDDYKRQQTVTGDAIAQCILNYVTLMHKHIHKEDNILFPLADKVLNTHAQKEIAEQFEKIEEEVVGYGVHEKYHKLLISLKSKYLE
jgi:hemerythrin-like domain-containing protein